MSTEIVQIVLPLTFIGVCALVGEILVHCHRDKAAQEQVQIPASHHESRKVGHSARKTART